MPGNSGNGIKMNKLIVYLKNILTFLSKKKENEIQSLNGLRAFSISLIFIVHSWGFFVPFASNEIVNSKISEFFFNATSGVDLFLILSGFLISLGLKKEFLQNGRIDFKLFFKKRILRIFPAYYFFLLISVIIFIRYNVPFQGTGLMVDFFYLSNYLPGQLPHTWSLSLEEQFYLLFPFIAHFFLFQISPQKRMYSLLLLYLVPGIIRILIFSGQELNVDEYAARIYKPAHTRMDAIVTGILLMEFYTEKSMQIKTFSSRLAFFPVFAISLVFLYFGHIHNAFQLPLLKGIFRYNFINIGYGLIFLLALGNNPLSSLFSLPVFRPIARLSYTMYLWNFILGGIGAKFAFGLKLAPFQWSMVIYAYFTVFVSITLLSVIPFGLIEYPFLKKKETLVN